MNLRTARRAERAEWEQRSSVNRAGRAACGPFFETRPTALRFLSVRAAPSPFISTEEHEEHEEGWVSFPVLPVFPGKSLAGAPPARSRRPGKAKRLARRRDAGAQVAAHTRRAARPTGRRFAASETSTPGGGKIQHTPEESSRGRQDLGLGLVRGGGFRRGAARRPMTARKDGRPTSQPHNTKEEK